MFVIAYKGGGVGCPKGGIYGELVECRWDSNNYEDSSFPGVDEKISFRSDHEVVNTDFFYFGSEFICSEQFLQVLKMYDCGRIDIREVLVLQRNKRNPIATKRYFLIRSREMHEIMDRGSSEFQERVDPRTGMSEYDFYHPWRVIYDEISKFSLRSEIKKLDFFVAAEMLMSEYVFSSRLVERLTKENMLGFCFAPVSDIFYDAKMDF